MFRIICFRKRKRMRKERRDICQIGQQECVGDNREINKLKNGLKIAYL